jgi:hypothetical protein
LARRLALTGCAVAIAATATVVALPATVDARTLPGGSVARRLVDGSTVKARLYDEAVRYVGNVANIPTSREAWVSGKIVVTVGGGAKGGTIAGGYVVGCQMNIGGVQNGYDPLNNQWGHMQNFGATLHLGPGQTGWIPIIKTTYGTNTSDTGYGVNMYTFRGNRGGVAYSQESFRIDGCAGYASARARFTIGVETDEVMAQVVLWGRPFSIG